MGLMLRIKEALRVLWGTVVAYWRRPSFQAEAMALLREMSAVTRQQAQTSERMAAALEQFAAFYTVAGDPEKWVAEDDNALLIEMLTRETRASEES